MVTIDEKKNSGALRDAINDGKRIIVTTLQKFPVIYNEVESAVGKHYAVIVDEAHRKRPQILYADLPPFTARMFKVKGVKIPAQKKDVPAGRR